MRKSPLKRRSAQYRKRYAAKGGECRHKAASAHVSPAMAALSSATLARVRSSKKTSVCQGRAAFGGCYANLDSLPPFCKGLEAARVEGIFLRHMYALSILPPSARPQGREHGSQDKLPNISTSRATEPHRLSNILTFGRTCGGSRRHIFARFKVI